MTDVPTQQAALSPFATIWRSPTSTLRNVLNQNPDILLPLAIAGGIGDFFLRVFTGASELRTVPLLGTLWLMVLLGGALWGVVWVHLIGGALYLAGRWQGGHAAFRTLVAAVTWSRLPVAATLAWWIPATLLFGRDLFALPRRDLSNGVEAVVLLCACLVALVGMGWGLFLLVRGIQVAQGFKVGRALGSLAIVVALLLAAGVALVLAVAVIA